MEDPAPSTRKKEPVVKNQKSHMLDSDCHRVVAQLELASVQHLSKELEMQHNPRPMCPRGFRSQIQSQCLHICQSKTVSSEQQKLWRNLKMNSSHLVWSDVFVMLMLSSLGPVCAIGNLEYQRGNYLVFPKGSVYVVSASFNHCLSTIT